MLVGALVLRRHIKRRKRVDRSRRTTSDRLSDAASR